MNLCLSDNLPVTLEDVFEAYYECRRNKRNKQGALEFEVNLEENLITLWQELCSGSWKPSQSIVFLVYKPVMREIFAANFRDRIVHHLILKFLNPLFEQYFIYDSYSCRVGKGTHFGIDRVANFIKSSSMHNTKNVWILKIDIQSFFMSINRHILFSRLEEFIKKFYFEKNRDFLINLCKIVIFNEPTHNCIFHSNFDEWKLLPKNKSLFYANKGCGLPIGNFTSQVFANFYLTEFDYYIKNICGIRYYGRYVDDCVIAHHSKSFLLKLLVNIKRYLKLYLGLTLHPKKIYLQPYKKGLRFLGTFIKPTHIVVNMNIIRNFREAINRGNDLADERRPTKEEMKKFISSINSYLGIMKHYKTYKKRRKLLTKFISQNWKKHVMFVSNFEKIQIKGRE